MENLQGVKNYKETCGDACVPPEEISCKADGAPRLPFGVYQRLFENRCLVMDKVDTKIHKDVIRKTETRN